MENSHENSTTTTTIILIAVEKRATRMTEIAKQNRYSTQMAEKNIINKLKKSKRDEKNRFGNTEQAKKETINK